MVGEIIVLKHAVLECLMSLVPGNIYFYLAVMFVTCNTFQFGYPHTHSFAVIKTTAYRVGSHEG
jgi:hypothetical protein